MNSYIQSTKCRTSTLQPSFNHNKIQGKCFIRKLMDYSKLANSEFRYFVKDILISTNFHWKWSLSVNSIFINQHDCMVPSSYIHCDEYVKQKHTSFLSLFLNCQDIESSFKNTYSYIRVKYYLYGYKTTTP